MGCDIHMFVEYKVGDAPWQADKNHKVTDDDGYKYLEEFPFDARNYELFGALAGVRCKGPEAKGLPEDCSEIIKDNTDIEADYGDDHSHSYCSFTEYKKALRSCGYNLPKKREQVNWDTEVKYEDRYAAGVAYIEQQLKRLKQDIEAEKLILGQDLNTKVEARLVFWFDN